MYKFESGNYLTIAEEILQNVDLGELLGLTYTTVATIGTAMAWQFLDEVCTEDCWTVVLNSLHPGWGETIFDTDYAIEHYSDCETWN